MAAQRKSEPVQVLSRKTDRIIQCIIDNKLNKLQKLIKGRDINGLYPSALWNDDVTLLTAAVNCENEEICTFLLDKGADPNKASTNGLSPLNYALHYNVRVELVGRLLAAKADPNKSPNLSCTPFLVAVDNDREDIVRELLKYGGLAMTAPSVAHRATNMIHRLSAENEHFAKIRIFFDFQRAVPQKSPKEVFDIYSKHLLEEHPVDHLILFDLCCNGIVASHAEEYREASIKCLRESQNIDMYVEGAIKRFPKMHEFSQFYAVNTLYVVFCIMKEISLEVSLAIVPIILKCLQFVVSSEWQTLNHISTLIKLLYVISQKTKQKEGWNTSFLEDLCKIISPLTRQYFTPEIGIYTYDLLANLCAFDCVHSIMTSIGVTSVPEKILNDSETQLDQDLKERIRKLNTSLNKPSSADSFSASNSCKKSENSTQSKKKKGANREQLLTEKGTSGPGENTDFDTSMTLKSQGLCSAGNLSEELENCTLSKSKKKKKKKGAKQEGLSKETTEKADSDASMIPIEESCLFDENSTVKPFTSSTETSTLPRKWRKTSHRWRPQLEKLANIDASKVYRLQNFTLVVNAEFQIAKGSDGTEVFLGLSDDGIEVAIKQMRKSNYEVLENEVKLLQDPTLESPYIVRYVYSTQDDNFGYLFLHLCEFTLEEYIQDQLPEDTSQRTSLLKKFVHEVLDGLKVLHSQNPIVIQRDIKPQNVFIDTTPKARLADFGISRRLNVGQTTLRTSSAGTKCWKARETVDEDNDSGYKRSSDIQVAGMLVYYILSGGHHPFGRGACCEYNILMGKYSLEHVEDEVAKDLVEWMIHGDPKERPTVEETLAHPYFWNDERRVEYLKKMGNEKEAESCRSADPDLQQALEEHAVGKTFSEWKAELPSELIQKLDGKKKAYPETTLGLLRFIRNMHEHYPEDAETINLMTLFPDLFGSVYKFAKAQEWNSRASLKKCFKE